MTKLLAIVSEQGTACYEACLCERCHANPEHRAVVEKKAARINDIPNPADWQDATGNDALMCNVCGRVEELLPTQLAILRHEAMSRGFQAEPILVELRGVCRECRQKAGARNGHE